MTTVFQNFFFFFLFFALGLEIHTLLDLGRFESQCWPFSFKFLWFSSWFKNHDSWKPSLCCAQSSWSFDILLTVEVIILLQQLEFWLFFLPLEARPPNVDDYCPLPAPPRAQVRMLNSSLGPCGDIWRKSPARHSPARHSACALLGSELEHTQLFRQDR